VKQSPAPASAGSRALPVHRGRDTLIAVAGGIAVLAFILYAIAYLSKQADSTGGVDGTIISKEFVPQPETQITFGQGGLSRRSVAGDYIFRVRVPRENGRVYRVSVDSATYDSHQVGDPYYFLRPQARSAAPASFSGFPSHPPLICCSQ
jgi:hypothetical protein